MSDKPADPDLPIETRRLQREEICRAFGVPPALLATDHAAFYRKLRSQVDAFHWWARDALVAWIEQQEREQSQNRR